MVSLSLTPSNTPMPRGRVRPPEQWSEMLPRVWSLVPQSMTFREIGERASLHPESVRRYLRGTPPPIDSAAALMRALDGAPQFIMTGDGPARPGDQMHWALEHASLSQLLAAVATRLSRSEPGFHPDLTQAIARAPQLMEPHHFHSHQPTAHSGPHAPWTTGMT